MLQKILKSALLLAFVCAFGTTDMLAQTGEITGTLIDSEDSQPLPGANVFIGSLNKGTATNSEGNFTIEDVPYGTYTVRFSFIGYNQKTMQVSVDRAVVNLENIALQQSVQGLQNVVVTALGIERQEKSLGYSVQEVQGEDLNTIQETNFVNTLTGKVAGANISSSNAMGGSSRIVLRGVKSITGNNQPLFVVDGVPLDNSNFTSASQEQFSGGYDYGNAASVINPNDVKSVSVLKGPSATALYGSRAANGVIQITTKDGSNVQGLGVSINSGVSINRVYELPNYQNRYGGGSNAPFSVNGQGQFVADFATDESWGPPLDGRQVRQWYSYDNVNGLLGQTTPWVPSEGNVEDFFETGVSYNNNISLSKGGEDYNYRLSLSQINQTGVFPESKLERSQVGFNGSLDLSDKLSTSLSVNYSYSDVRGRPGTGYDNENVFLQFNTFGQRQVDMGEGSYLQDIVRPDGTQRAWNWANPETGAIRFTDNPYWVRERNFQNDDTQRIYGNFSITYDFTNNLSLKGEARTDYYTERRAERVAIGSQAVSNYSEDIYEVQETNARLTLTYKRDITEDISLDAFAAGNIRYNDLSQNIGQTQGGLSAPGIYTLQNSISRPDITDFFQKQKVHSLLGSATLGYQETIFLDATLRNDWSSTLPEDNNSYLYPSLSSSFVFSELDLFQDMDFLSFGKLRLGWAKVSSDTNPYNLSSTYPFDTPFGSLPQLSVSNALNNPNLKPETTTSWEIGTALEFFESRLDLDVTYYNDLTEDQIVAVEVSRASGYAQQLLNAGEISNRGLEAALSTIPVQTGDFQWTIDFNWAKNVSKVEELAPGISNLTLGGAPFNVTINARVGETYGALVGTDFVYDENGNKVLTPAGTYEATSSPQVLGSYVPDWTGGVSSSLRYKGFIASIAFDGQKGGDIYSISNAFGLYSGLFQETVTGDQREVGLVPEGVLANGQEFTGRVDPEAFYKSMFGVAAAHVYDASYIRLREVRLGYDMPQSWFSTLPIRGLRVSLVGRNLGLLFKNAPNIDPSNVISSGNIQGVEAGQIPPKRSFGFNLKLDL